MSCNDRTGTGQIGLVVEVFAGMAGSDWFVFDFYDCGFGGEEESCNTCGVLEGYAFDLGWDDDAHFYEVAVFVGEGVVAEGVVVGFFDLVCDDGAVEAAVCCDLFDRCGDSAGDDVDADAFVAVALLAEVDECATGAEYGGAAAGEDAFFDCCSAGVECVFYACFLLGHFNFGCCADIDLCYASGEFGEAFFEFF